MPNHDSRPNQVRALADDPSVNPFADPAMYGSDVEPEERRLAVKTFTIPSTDAGVLLYGPEIDLVDKPDFQRLAGIKQLGTSDFVYRGAGHHRYEHSLGTLYWADRIVRAARRNPSLKATEARKILDPSAHRLARLAALLHDITHVPFGHTLEDEFGLLERHDLNELRFGDFLGDDSQVASVLLPIIGPKEYAELCAILHAKDEDDFVALDRPFLADIVGNTVCADILDYVRRDLEACGMDVAISEHFLDYFTVTDEKDLPKPHQKRMALVLDKRGMPRPDVESEVIMLLTLRYELAERVYFHHAKNAASVMIARGVQLLGLATGRAPDGTWSEREDRNFHQLSDELLLRVLSDPRLADPLGLTIAPNLAHATISSVRDLGSRLLRRDLYKLTYLGVMDDLAHRVDYLFDRWGPPDRHRALEDELAAAAGVPRGHVLVHLPRPKMMRKQADVRVIVGDRKIVMTLNEWDRLHSQRVDALNRAHERLWRVAVYLHPSHADNMATRRLVQAAAEEAFGARSRYQQGPNMPYLEAVWEAEAANLGWPARARRPVLEDVRRREKVAFGGIRSLSSTKARMKAHLERFLEGEAEQTGSS